MTRSPHPLILHPGKLTLSQPVTGLGGTLAAGTVVTVERWGPGGFATVRVNGEPWCVSAGAMGCKDVMR
jgi:hypothetical protein